MAHSNANVSHPGAGTVVLLAALSWLSGMGHAHGDTAGLLERAGAHALSAARDAYPDGTVSVRMVPLDPRLRLASCEDLDLDIPGDRVAGRVSVRARCRAPESWGVYLTAQVDVRLPIVALTRPVPRDTVLRAEDLTLVPQDVGQLRDGYLTDPAAAVGMAARTNLRADSVLYQRHLAAPTLVSRGDSVTVASSHGYVSVTAQAIALSDGVYGEQIELRNPRSDRVLTGWVTGPGTVSTRPGPEPGAR